MMRKGNLALTRTMTDTSIAYWSFRKGCASCHIKKYALIKGDGDRRNRKISSSTYPDHCGPGLFPILTSTNPHKMSAGNKTMSVKGSVLGFDELNDPDSPGETVALKEVSD